MSLDLEKLFVPVSESNPSGNNEEYNPLYMQLEELAVGKPASVMGDSTVEGVDPDWHALEKNCLKLWETTRDLRVAMYLCNAEFVLNGLAGFSNALSLVEYLVKERWDDFHPQLDPDDDNDPTERLNIFAMISPLPGSYNDPLMFISKFRTVRLVEGKKYTLRDLMIVNGELDGTDEKIDPLFFRGEMNAVPQNIMREGKELTERITEQIRNIADTVNAHLPDVPVSFSSLLSELKTLQQFYQSHYVESAAGDVPEESSSVSEGEPAAAAPKQTNFFDLSTYEPGNRAEALLMLQKGAAYFQNAEPTSPVPFLVKRAIRMSSMNFLDLLGDIEQGAMEKGKEIFGVRPEEEQSDS